MDDAERLQVIERISRELHKRIFVDKRLTRLIIMLCITTDEGIEDTIWEYAEFVKRKKPQDSKL